MPKSGSALIGNQNIHRQSFVSRPNLRAQHLDGMPTKSLTATIPNDKKLAQINQVRLLAVQTISDDIATILKNHGSII